MSVAQDIPGMLTANAITVPAAAIRAEGVQICFVMSFCFAPNVHIRRAVLLSCMGSSTQYAASTTAHRARPTRSTVRDTLV